MSILPLFTTREVLKFLLTTFIKFITLSLEVIYKFQHDHTSEQIIRTQINSISENSIKHS